MGVVHRYKFQISPYYTLLTTHRLSLMCPLLISSPCSVPSSVSMRASTYNLPKAPARLYPLPTHRQISWHWSVARSDCIKYPSGGNQPSSLNRVYSGKGWVGTYSHSYCIKLVISILKRFLLLVLYLKVSGSDWPVKISFRDYYVLLSPSTSTPPPGSEVSPLYLLLHTNNAFSKSSAFPISVMNQTKNSIAELTSSHFTLSSYLSSSSSF